VAEQSVSAWRDYVDRIQDVSERMSAMADDLGADA
jgi:hypothetical protein